MCRLVHLLPSHIGEELERDRPEPDVQFRLPGVIADDLDELRAGHTGHDLRHVVQQPPGFVDRGRNVERVLDPHDVTIVAGGARLSRRHGIFGSWWSL